MKFYVIYEQDALATMESDIEGPYYEFEKATARARNLEDRDYDVAVVATINGQWCRLEEMDNEVFYKPVEKIEEYWMPLAQAGKV
jgi:hypothetical protein